MTFINCPGQNSNNVLNNIYIKYCPQKLVFDQIIDDCYEDTFESVQGAMIEMVWQAPGHAEQLISQPLKSLHIG
jgi:hypothetical protein